jgi:carbohydrate kinase (thermoresistant glucokinase family)
MSRRVVRDHQRMTGFLHAPGIGCDASAKILVMMGVSGVGKTVVARAVADRLGWAFQEGDALHPEANIRKMSAGEPLTDADRQPWLEAVAAWIDRQLAANACGVLTCSALKRAYRERIAGGRSGVRLVYLQASEPVIAARLAARSGHFMPPQLLKSQLETLEEPAADEHPIVIDASLPVNASVDAVLAHLELR